MQTSILKQGQPVAFAGQLSDNGEGVDIVSRVSTESSLEIAFGLAVRAATERNAVKTVSGANDVVVGVNVWGPNHMPGANGDLGTTGLKPKAGLQVLRRGRIWVVVDASVNSITPNADRCYVRHTANGGNTVLGAFLNAADGGNTIDLTKVGVFTSGLFTAADGSTKIAEVEINIVNKP